VDRGGRDLHLDLSLLELRAFHGRQDAIQRVDPVRPLGRDAPDDLLTARRLCLGGPGEPDRGDLQRVELDLPRAGVDGGAAGQRHGRVVGLVLPPRRNRDGRRGGHERVALPRFDLGLKDDNLVAAGLEHSGPTQRVLRLGLLAKACPGGRYKDKDRRQGRDS
jgi:hypothetical protein